MASSKSNHLSQTFYNARNFARDISGWQTSKLKFMNWTFAGTNSFNTNINGWDVEEVVNMNNMFNSIIFNQPLDQWKTYKVNIATFPKRNSI